MIFSVEVETHASLTVDERRFSMSSGENGLVGICVGVVWVTGRFFSGSEEGDDGVGEAVQ